MSSQRFQVYLGDNYARDSVADISVARDLLFPELGMEYKRLLEKHLGEYSGYWPHFSDNDLRLNRGMEDLV